MLKVAGNDPENPVSRSNLVVLVGNHLSHLNGLQVSVVGKLTFLLK